MCPSTTLKRATDTAPTGLFADYQTAAGASVWRVDIEGNLAAGTVPPARLSPVTGTGNVVLSTAPTLVTPQVTDTLLVDAVSNGISLLRLQRATDTTPTGAFVDYQTAAGASVWRVGIDGALSVGSVPLALVSGTSHLCTTLGICTGYEAVANKSTNTALGGSNTLYPTQGAVKSYVDSGAKALTNTAVTPRQCTGGPGSPVLINADNLTGCDFVQVAELSGATTIDLTAGTYVNGQFLTVLIYTTTQRALTFTTGAAKFAAEGIALPTFTRAAGYVLYGFRYNGISNRWALAATNQETNYGTAGYIQTAGGPGVESSWQPPTGGGEGQASGCSRSRQWTSRRPIRLCSAGIPMARPCYASTIIRPSVSGGGRSA